jgi:hypothetical protein
LSTAARPCRGGWPADRTLVELELSPGQSRIGPVAVPERDRTGRRAGAGSDRAPRRSGIRPGAAPERDRTAKTVLRPPRVPDAPPVAVLELEPEPEPELNPSLGRSRSDRAPGRSRIGPDAGP